MSPENHRTVAEGLLVKARGYPLHSPARLSLLVEAQVRATLATLPDEAPPPPRRRTSKEATS